MSAINVLTLPNIFVPSYTCCECVCDRAETQSLLTREPVVSARWMVEIDRNGTRRLVERWSIKRQKSENGPSKPEAPSRCSVNLCAANGQRRQGGQP